MGNACSRTPGRARDSPGWLGSAGALPHAPPRVATLAHRLPGADAFASRASETLTHEAYDELAGAPSTLLHLAVRAVVTAVASGSALDALEPPRFVDDALTVSGPARGLRLPAPSVRDLPPDLAQLVFDALCATRRLGDGRWLVRFFEEAHLTRADLGLDQNAATDEFLLALRDVAYASLASLSLAKCALLTDDGFACLGAFRSLARLDLGECDQLDDRGLRALADGAAAASLEALSLAGCDGVTGPGLAHVGKLRGLRFLSLERCKNVRCDGGLQSDGGLRAVAGLVELEVLNAGWVNDAGDADVVALAGLVKLRELNLARTRVTDRAMGTIGSFGELRALNLAGCRITNKGLSCLTRLTKLEELSVEFCRVNCAGAADVARLRSLTHVNLAFTQVGDEGVKRLGALAELRWLNLDSTRVGDASMRSLATNAPKLETLNLSDTAVGNAGLEELARGVLRHAEERDKEREKGEREKEGEGEAFPSVSEDTSAEDAPPPRGCGASCSLKHLDLGYSNVDDLGVAHLRDVTSLRSLSLDSRLITDDGLRHLVGLRDLEALDLFGARVTDRGTAALRHMPRLRRLEMCGGSLTDEGVKAIGASCRDLTTLNLGQNYDVGDDGVEALLELKNLTHLNLQHSRITDASLDRLGEELKGLVNVSLKGCAWVSERGVEGLKRRCPKLNEVGWAPSPRPSVDDSENGGGGPY